MMKVSKSNEPTIFQLTRIKQWYIPADAESYLTLRRAGVALTRFHQDFLPTLKLLTKGKNIRGREVDFHKDIMQPYFDKIGRTWNKKPHCDCTISKKTMVFETLKAEALPIAKASIPKLQDLLTRFFQRWGYRSTFEYSELRGKCKLNVEYWFDPERQPVVILEDEKEELNKKIQFKLGNLRLTFTFDNFESRTVIIKGGGRSNEDGIPPKDYQIGYVHTLIEISQGGKFTPVQSSRCTWSELSSVKPLIAALMDVPNRQPNNFNEAPD
jgi:hypothetical protein